MYKKYFLMLTCSFVAMYIVMYLHTYEFDHVAFSVTRLYMTFLMICPMALIMLGFMRDMYKNKNMNMAIMASSLLIFVLVVFLVRTQAFIGDKNYMKGMIPHHSIAILTSERAKITDPEVKKLAEEIIKTQKEEIEQMKQILDRMGN